MHHVPFRSFDSEQDIINAKSMVDKSAEVSKLESKKNSPSQKIKSKFTYIRQSRSNVHISEQHRALKQHLFSALF